MHGSVWYLALTAILLAWSAVHNFCRSDCQHCLLAQTCDRHLVLLVSAVVDAECRDHAAQPLADVVSHMQNVSWMFSSAQQPVTCKAVSTQLSRLSIADTDDCKAAQLWFWATP